jgi:hypothetical protein
VFDLILLDQPFMTLTSCLTASKEHGIAWHSDLHISHRSTALRMGNRT